VQPPHGRPIPIVAALVLSCHALAIRPSVLLLEERYREPM